MTSVFAFIQLYNLLKVNPSKKGGIYYELKESMSVKNLKCSLSGRRKQKNKKYYFRTGSTA